MNGWNTFSFPFGARPIFRGEVLLVSGRVGVSKNNNGKTPPNHPFVHRVLFSMIFTESILGYHSFWKHPWDLETNFCNWRILDSTMRTFWFETSANSNSNWASCHTYWHILRVRTPQVATQLFAQMRSESNTSLYQWAKVCPTPLQNVLNNYSWIRNQSANSQRQLLVKPTTRSVWKSHSTISKLHSAKYMELDPNQHSSFNE